MKRYLVWFRLLMKRALKNPAFLLFLLSMPLLSLLVDRLGQGVSEGIAAGICIEGWEAEAWEDDGVRGEEARLEEAGTEGEETRIEGTEARLEEAGTERTEASEEAGTEKIRRFLALLSEQEGIVRLRVYDSEAEMRHAVEKGELDCGVFLREELWEGLETGTWQGTITILESSSSSMTQIVKEKIASLVFTLYSEENYVNYIKSSEVFFREEETGTGADIDESAGTEGTSADTDIAEFARTAYETHLLDGSTFAFQYQENQIRSDGGNLDRTQAGDDGNLTDGDRNRSDAGGTLAGGENPDGLLDTSFRLRGILAVCIFLSGLCGLLTDWKDRSEKRFLRLTSPIVTTMVNIWIPTVYTSAAAFFSLWLTGNITASGSEKALTAGLASGFGKEIFGLLFYQFLIVLYCSIIRIVLRRQETIAAAIPLFVLCSVICCPVWIRLAVYVPLFRVLEKFFPVTYYLLL